MLHYEFKWTYSYGILNYRSLNIVFIEFCISYLYWCVCELLLQSFILLIGFILVCLNIWIALTTSCSLFFLANKVQNEIGCAEVFSVVCCLKFVVLLAVFCECGQLNTNNTHNFVWTQGKQAKFSTGYIILLCVGFFCVLLLALRLV